MKAVPSSGWARFETDYHEFPECDLALDLSRLSWEPGYVAQMAKPMERVFAHMKALEGGAIANPDEKRQVGHYWLRDAALAPDPTQAQAVRDAIAQVKAFAHEVHSGALKGQSGEFRNVLVVGIGGSALGPQLVANALGDGRRDRLRPAFLDNTDPDGIDRALQPLREALGRTLVLVISKSGGTPETRNGMLEVAAAYRSQGLEFARHAVAVTQFSDQSSLYRLANDSKAPWLRCFPMWDWVGGRTSVTSAVGLLPAALQGLDIDGLLAGARQCDVLTRRDLVTANPAALMALAWHHTGGGRGAKDMVVLPYKDRLDTMARYLQQLIMESLGKELDLDQRVVNQGIAVYGNKGSTDQHAYVQQLREGLNNFFVTFIEVLRDREGASIEVEPGITAGDFLNGFLLGTRAALHEKGRESVTLTLGRLDAFTLGTLIALFERTVGLYAALVNINAYHQPGVEAGKKAASAILGVKSAVLGVLKASPGKGFTAEALSAELETKSRAAGDAEVVFKICQHLAANPQTGVQRTHATPPTRSLFSYQHAS
ncbi:MAG: glucose-6-phosphate isomerase [Verrucomicrobiales bacterium]|nr:glucose-6-phosphate isomerase [Verrucomicrobiales bacterium]